jgi:hypothetical protein
MDHAPPVRNACTRCWRQAISVALCLCIGSGIARATEIYKSVDADGHVTYSDRPIVSDAPADQGLLSDGSSDMGGVGATSPPPPLPDVDQPPCPEDGDLWTPGYWAWDGAEYSWVSGVWVIPPGVEVFWTPGYWGYSGNVFVFHRGYWGPRVGYYGSINYGFGYPGTGYVGGRWVGKVFLYNSAVNHLDASMLRHAYDEPESNHRSASRVSYNGGPGGTSTVASAQDRLAAQSRLQSSAQHIHLQENPVPSAPTPSGSGQSAATAKPAVPRPPPSVARRTSVSAVTAPAAPANAATRPAPTTAKTARPRTSPTIRSISIK